LSQIVQRGTGHVIAETIHETVRLKHDCVIKIIFHIWQVYTY